jgi:hypothetical protein
MAAVSTAAAAAAGGTAAEFRDAGPAVGVVANAQALLPQTGPGAPAEPALVGIGELERRILRFLLTGSRNAKGPCRERIWATCVILLGLSAGLLAVPATQPEVIGTSKAFQSLGYAAAIIWPSLGFVAAECTAIMAGTLPHPDADRLLPPSGGSEGSGRAMGPQFMASLLEAKVTPQCAAGIARRVRMSVFIMLPPFGCFMFCITILSQLVRQGGEATAVQTAVMLVGYLAWPASLLQASGWLLFLQVPASIARDMVRSQQGKKSRFWLVPFSIEKRSFAKTGLG